MKAPPRLASSPYRVALAYYLLATTGQKDPKRVRHFRLHAEIANSQGFRLTIPDGYRITLE